MEQVKIIKIYGNAVWVEKDIFGDAHVMLQSEGPGSEPACVATVRYNYPWVDNSTRDSVATGIARMFGAGEDVEFRFRELPVSS